MHNALKPALFAALVLLGHSAMAQSVSSSLGLVVYPANNQAAAQISKDEGECHSWARQSTGVDPANPMAGVPPAQAAAPPGGPPPAAGGAARGAARGAIIGNLADEDAGEFAAAGMVIGAARGAKQRHAQQAQAQANAQAQNQAQAQERLGMFTRAYSACMEARNYTVR